LNIYGQNWKGVLESIQLWLKNIRVLETALQEEWSQITDDVLMNLIKSKGWPTKD